MYTIVNTTSFFYALKTYFVYNLYITELISIPLQVYAYIVIYGTNERMC